MDFHLKLLFQIFSFLFSCVYYIPIICSLICLNNYYLQLYFFFQSPDNLFARFRWKILTRKFPFFYWGYTPYRQWSSHKQGIEKFNWGCLEPCRISMMDFFCKNSLRHASSLKKRFWYMCFLVNFEKFLRKPFFQNTSGRLLLYLKHFEVKAEEVLADNEMYYVQSQVT